MNKKEYNQWLIIGIEDGWIYVDKDTWNEYLKAKKEGSKYGEKEI